METKTANVGVYISNFPAAVQERLYEISRICNDPRWPHPHSIY